MTSPPSVERAVRFDTHVLPQGPRVAARPVARAKSALLALIPTRPRSGIIRSFLVTDDPEPRLAAATRRRALPDGGLRALLRGGGPGRCTVVQRRGRISQRVFIGNVDKCVDELTDFIERYGFTDVVTWGSAPGLQPEALTPSMERFAAEVVPRVRSRPASRTHPRPR